MNQLLLRPVRLILPVLFLWLAAGLSAASPDSLFRVIEELDVKVTTRDGVRLSTNIYRPDAPGRFPALLTRTPYGNGGAGDSFRHYFAARGYAVVVQDTRGRYESEGEFDAFQAEGPDGLDTHQWLAAQPWCDGRIGTWGGSYVGFTQWLPAGLGSPAVRAMFPIVTFSDLHDMVWQGGAFRLGLFTGWSLEMTKPWLLDNAHLERRGEEIFRALPLREQDRAAGWRIGFLRDWLAHPAADRYWERTSIGQGHRNITAGAYNVGGWFDICLSGTLENFVRMTAPEIDPAVRAKQRLLIGPWVHAISRDGKTGELDFGKEAGVDLQELARRWFDHQLKGVDNGIGRAAPVRLFVMGENHWRDEQEWPLARTRYTDFHLHSGGNANTLDGDGWLNTQPAQDESPDIFLYDPIDPAPSSPDGPHDQRKVEGRPDVLIYSTSPLKAKLEVTGPVRAELYAASSAANTDFTAKLVDVYPDGRAIELCQGIIRAAFREGETNPTNIRPGTVYRYEIDLWATSNVFLPGHRIRLEVASSSFPKFDRNLNTGGPADSDSVAVTAEQRVFHNRQYHSRLILPVIE